MKRRLLVSTGIVIGIMAISVAAYAKSVDYANQREENTENVVITQYEDKENFGWVPVAYDVCIEEITSQELHTAGPVETDPPQKYSWGSDEREELAHIAMAEAEGQSLECKMYVIWTVLNRVEANEFPDTIHDVIYEYNEHSGVYQFSCIGNGRYDRVEPNEECYKAVELVETSDDTSKGVLYFEDCENEDNWHSRNLEFLYECDSVRFYK